MATSRPSSNSPDVIDVLMVILAFEDLNHVCVELRIGRVGSGEQRDLGVTAIAHPEAESIGDLPPLASVSLRCSAMNLRTIDAVVLNALYALDSQLARNEFEGIGQNRA